MYEDFYQLTTEPFRLSPDHRFCFAHSSYEKAKAYMEYALHQAEGFVMITGKPGCGKTTLIHDLIDDLPQAKVKVAMLMITQLEGDDLLRMVAYAFGLTAESSDKATIIEELTVFLKRQHKEGKRALLIVDEAQNLSISAMEELRLLTNLQSNNQPLLQIFLLGQEELRDLMQSPKMVQGHQRIVAASHLKPLLEEEVGDYVRHRLSQAGWNGNPQISTTIFPIIHKFSRGIPRIINLICSRLFLNAFVEEEHRIGVNTIKIVLNELQLEQLLPAFPEFDADALFDQADDYPIATKQAPDSEPETTSVPAPIYDLEAHRARDTPTNTPPPTEHLEPESVGPKPVEPQPVEPEPVEPEPVEPEPVEPEPVEPEPVEPEPVEPEAVEPEPVEPEPVEPETAALTEPAEIPPAASADPNDRTPTKGNGRYWLIALSLSGLLAVGGVSYFKYRDSLDFVPLIQRAQQLKTQIVANFIPNQPTVASKEVSPTLYKYSPDTSQKMAGSSSVKAPQTQSAKSTESAEPPVLISNSVVKDQDQPVEVTLENNSTASGQAVLNENIETPDDVLGTITPIVEGAELSNAKSPIENQIPKLSSIDTIETSTATTTAAKENKTRAIELPARQILFNYKSMEIPPQFKKLLDEVAVELNEAENTVARIVGIVDSRGKASLAYKRGISTQRATEVSRYLNDLGISPERLRIEEDADPQETGLDSSKNARSPKPQRLVEVTVLIPTD